MSFPFEKLRVYQESLCLIDRIDEILSEIRPFLSYGYCDQLARASLSVPLNLAEGYGRWHSKDREHFFRIARGSVFECAAILEVTHRKRVLSEVQYRACYAHLERVAKMLTALLSSECKRVREAHTLASR